MRIGLDTSAARARFARLRASAPAAGAAALRAAATTMMASLHAAVPRDTRRMVRGFQLAANKATLGPFFVEKVVASRSAERIAASLQRQIDAARRRVERWERFKRHYESRGRTGEPYFRKVILVQLDPNRRGTPARALRRAEEEAARFAATDGSGILVENRGRALRLTVRNKVYGGDGRFSTVGDASYVTIINREPHAIIQERRRRSVDSVIRAAKGAGTGLRRARAAFLHRLEAVAEGSAPSTRE